MMRTSNSRPCRFVVVTMMLAILRTIPAFQHATRCHGSATTTRFIGSRSSNIFRSSLSVLWEQKQQQRLSNQELAERRISVFRAKREARSKTIKQRVDKNLRIKRLLSETQTSADTDHQDSSSSSLSSSSRPLSLYAIKVWVDETLREELKLSGREKRGRVFIEKYQGDDNGDKSNVATTTLKGLRQELHSFFTSLKKGTFLLTANLPVISNDGKILSEHPPKELSWTIETDQDVIQTFEKADRYFLEQQQTEDGILKRPSIQINIWKDPNAPPPPLPPTYLENMADPARTESMTMISFYAFPPNGIKDPEAFAFDLKKKWKPFNALGRVYVAEEGVNAQMSIPTNILENFMNCCRSIPELGTNMENDINIDPVPLSLEEFQVAGVPVNGKPAPPFRNLHVRVRTQIVADGLEKSLDWQSAGYDMPPLEWHAKLKEARDIRQQENAGSDNENKDFPILLDCRNDYETDVGIFDGAEPLGTENFRESWDVLKDRLADTPKDAPIMTYCTGGIRCVKVSAL